MAKRRPLKAIREKCLDCVGGSRKEVRQCTIHDCPLYEYRFGHRPKADTSIEGGEEVKKIGTAVGGNGKIGGVL